MCNNYLKKSTIFPVFLCFLLCVFPSLILVFFPFLCSFKKESDKHVVPALEPREVNSIWDVCFGWNIDLLKTTEPRLAAMVMKPCLMTLHMFTMKTPITLDSRIPPSMLCCHKEQRLQAHTQKKVSIKNGIICSNRCHFRVSSTLVLYQEVHGLTSPSDVQLS